MEFSDTTSKFNDPKCSESGMSLAEFSAPDFLVPGDLVGNHCHGSLCDSGGFE